MATAGSSEGAFTWNAKDLSKYITTTLPSIEEANETEDVTPLGGAISVQAFTKLTTYGEVALGGVWDDEANGPEAVVGAGVRARTLASMVVTWKSGKTTTITNVGIKNYKRTQAKGSLHHWDATFFLGPSAAVTEA